MERCPRGAVELGIFGFVCFWFGVLVFFFKAKLTAVLVITCKITKLHLFPSCVPERGILITNLVT